MKQLRLLIIATALAGLAGCSLEQHGYQDIDTFMAQMDNQPSGNIDSLPEFRPYEAFAYQAKALRSPFKQPVRVSLTTEQIKRNIKPNTSRVKEYLEQFDLDSFRLVGSISNDEGFWGLVHGSDGVYRVRVGDYLGRDHGRITFIDDQQLQLVEIVPAGPKYWIERSRVLLIQGY